MFVQDAFNLYVRNVTVAVYNFLLHLLQTLKNNSMRT